MKELTFGTLIAVFEENFGPTLFWNMVIAVAMIALAYLYVLICDLAVSWHKFLRAQLSMPFGAVFAVLFVQKMTHSGFSDIGGPIDLIILLGIAVTGAVGAAILVCTFDALFLQKPTDQSE